MHRVVTVGDVGSAIFPELHLERDLAAGAQAPDILSDQVFGRRERKTSPVQGDALLEMEVDRVVPTTAAVDQGPPLDLAGPRDQLGNAVGVKRMRVLTIDLDGPREHRGFRAIGGALTGLWVARVAVA